jgi:hypothetical protein
MFVNSHCSPYVKNDNDTSSCLSNDKILELAKSLSINTNKKDMKSIYSLVKNKMNKKHNCNKEVCWIKKTKNKKLDKYFKPVLPKELRTKRSAWLSNYDIDKVCKQYDNNLNDFVYMNASPIDFNKCSVNNKLCKLNVDEYKNKGCKKMGFVFNTDTSNKPGKHWISMYVDLVGQNLEGTPGIYYFDSFGKKPKKQVLNLIKKINKDKQYIVSYNEKCHQRNTYACGFYCMHFLEHMIKGMPFKKYNTDGLSDTLMKNYIDKVFINPSDIM